jgi:hypothetical protein
MNKKATQPPARPATAGQPCASATTNPSLAVVLVVVKKREREPEIDGFHSTAQPKQPGAAPSILSVGLAVKKIDPRA